MAPIRLTANKPAALLTATVMAANAAAAWAGPSLAAPEPCRAARLVLNVQETRISDDAKQQIMGLLLRNAGAASCLIAPLPDMAVLDAQGRRLNIARVVPGTRFMHPGPVVLPLTLAPHAAIRASLRWDRAPRHALDVCQRPSSIEVHAVQGTVSAAVSGVMCGPGSGPAELAMTRFEAAAAQPD